MYKYIGINNFKYILASVELNQLNQQQCIIIYLFHFHTFYYKI